jgi:uncharacterized protein YodC (DUF2158 family)
MTVEEVGPDLAGTETVWCNWFEGANKFTASFKPAALNLAADE